MKMRATITVDLEFPDYISAGEGQRRLTDWHERIRAEYPNAEIDLRERRVTGARRRDGPPMPVRRPTGALRRYDDQD